MAFNTKRKEAKAAEAQEHIQEEQNYDAAINEAQQLADPAGQVIALGRLSDKIVAQIKSEDKIINEKAKGAEKKTEYAVAAPVVGGIAGLLLIAGPIGWACGGAALASSYGGSYVAKKRKESVKKKLDEAAASHTDRLHTLAGRSLEIAEGIVEKDVVAIWDSPLRAKVLDLPHLSEKFAEAVAQHNAAVKAAIAAKAEEEAAAAKKPPASNPKPKGEPKYETIKKSGL